MRRRRGRRVRRRGRSTALGSDAAGSRLQIGRGLEIAAALVVVVGALLATGRWLVDSGETLLQAGGSEIKVRQVVLVNGALEVETDDMGQLIPKPASTPHLDITVRNTGKTPVLLTGVRVTIEDSARLAICEYHSGGPVPSSLDYAVELPVLPIPRQRTLTHPLHQEVPAGEVDRFRVFLGASGFGEDNIVYALRIALIGEDSSQPVQVGRFVLSVPESVNRGGRLLPEGTYPPGVVYPGEQLVSSWCLRRNLSDLNRVLQRPGKRSSSMAALAGFQYADWWSSFADPRPARRAVGYLLRSDLSEGPVLGAFAAEQTGDRQLAAATRRQASDLLFQRAEKALSEYDGAFASDAVIQLRYALLFDPSEEIKSLLAEAEARQELNEAEAELERKEYEEEILG